MTTVCSQKPFIISAIHDAVVALDVESALQAAGIECVSYRPDIGLAEVPAALGDCRLILMDQDLGWSLLEPLAERANVGGIPALILMYDEHDRTIPPALTGAMRWSKPFDTEKLVDTLKDATRVLPLPTHA